jgi:membrane fusion protein, multidrug efflux system
MSESRLRGRGWMLAGTGLLVALGVAAYGITYRNSQVQALQQRADQAAIPTVQVTYAKPGPAQEGLTLPGDVAAWNQASIYAQVSGYVAHWYKDYGAHVTEGELLADISTPGLDAQYAASQASLETAIANYKLAQLTAGRFVALRNSPAVSQQQIDDKTSAADVARAQVAAAAQQVDRYQALIAFKRVVAPFAGVVTARRVNIGDYVTTSGGDASATGSGSASPLFSVADVSKLRIFVAVPQYMGAVLKPGIKATLTLPGKPGKPISADFLTTAGAVSPATRTIVTEFVVTGEPSSLYPGTFVNVELTTPSDPNILTVPSQALLFRSAGTQVATVNDGQHVDLKDISIGRNLGLETEVTAGLTETDKIVANPSLGLLEGEQVTVVQPVSGYGPNGNAIDTQRSSADRRAKSQAD